MTCGSRVQSYLDSRISRELSCLIGALYGLKVHVQEGTSWNQRAVILGQGPLLNEDRSIEMDVSNVPGDKLRIRLNPPMGFWAIDSLGITYDEMEPVEPTEVKLGSTEDPTGKDVSELLRQADKQYQVLPEVGDWFKATFPAPVQKDGTKRTVFLKTSGYYEIHLSKDQPEQTGRIQAFMNTPGSIVQYAMEEYLKYSAQTAQVR